MLGSNVFESAESFDRILTGCYIEMTQTDLYGSSLTIFDLELASKLYTLAATEAGESPYYNAANCLWDTEDGQRFALDVWGGMYNVIVNLNTVITEIANTTLLSADEKSRILAEALTMRAYCHLDLLRIYGPANLAGNSAGLSATAIPYVTEVGTGYNAHLKTSEVLSKIHADLDMAIEQFNSFNAEEIPSSEMNRGFLTVWAAKAIKGRAYMWEGKYAEAIEPLESVIKSDRFIVGVPTERYDSYDDASIEEWNSMHVFRLDGHDVYNRSSMVDFFFLGTQSGNTGNPEYKIVLSGATHGAIYESATIGTPDFRKTAWWKIDANSGEAVTLKYETFEEYGYIRSVMYDDDSSKGHIPNTIPMLKTAEVYYMLVEALVKTNTRLADAKAYLQAVRIKHSLEESTMGSDLMLEVLKEYHKEFVGDGQLFYLYKRLGEDTLLKKSFTNSEFVVPIPFEESI